MNETQWHLEFCVDNTRSPEMIECFGGDKPLGHGHKELRISGGICSLAARRFGAFIISH